jgi:hypothetical protein
MYASLAGKTDVPASVAKKFVGPKAHNDGGAVKESPVKKPLPPFMKKEAKKPADKAKGKKELPPFMKKDAKPKKMAYGGKAC